MTLEGYRSKNPWHINSRLYNSRLNYEDLPDPIKHSYSENEYKWMSDDAKTKLIENECLPEVEED